MDLFIENPGLCHIGEIILNNLDLKTQLNCRLVKKSWKHILDKEASKIDVETFFNNFVSTEIGDDNHYIWIHFTQCVNSISRKNVFIKAYLLTVLKKMINSKKMDNSPLEEFYSRKNYKFLEMILKEEMYNHIDFQQVTQHAVRFGPIFMIKFLNPFVDSYTFMQSILLATKRGRLDILKVLLSENSNSYLVLLAAYRAFGPLLLASGMATYMMQIANKS